MCVAFLQAGNGDEVEGAFGGYDESGLTGGEAEEGVGGGLEEGDDGLDDANIAIYEVLVAVPAPDGFAG